MVGVSSWFDFRVRLLLRVVIMISVRETIIGERHFFSGCTRS